VFYPENDRDEIDKTAKLTDKLSLEQQDEVLVEELVCRH